MISLPQAGNRSLLFHALDSSNPYLMAKAFLVGAEKTFFTVLNSLL
jgi:hypothetical protein